MISIVDTKARHGHKSRTHRFNDYKVHLTINPDGKLITKAEVEGGDLRATNAKTRTAEYAARIARRKRSIGQVLLRALLRSTNAEIRFRVSSEEIIDEIVATSSSRCAA